jgi:hypothetical protein
MDDRVSRIPANRLCLGDGLPIESPDGVRWARVISLGLDDDVVVVHCEGHPDPVRVPGTASIRVRRARGPLGADADEETALEAGISTWYPGDLRAAGSAVLQHAFSDRSGDKPSGGDADIHHYPGLYGGDLDHVVTALGGTPDDLSPADLRTEAFQRSAAAKRAVAAARGVGEPDDVEEENLSGDVGGLVDGRDR